jgi:hypothetical protein
VNLEINKAFKILLSVLLCFPFIGLIAQIFSNKEEFIIIFILVAILQLLMIRYVFIELGFRRLSKISLNRLRDVLDMEWIEKS